MIEVNLLPGKKQISISSSQWAFLSALNIRLLLIALIYNYVGRPLYEGLWDADLEVGKNELAQAQMMLRKATEKTKELRTLKEEYDLLLKQETNLRNKLEAVNKIVKNKRNPMGILLYLSKNIPQDVWVTKVAVNNDLFEIEGESYSYKSIGVFLEKLKDSVFFNKDIHFDDARTLSDSKDGKRTEYFKISSSIERYE